jgi:type IV pilus assembly protein PilN
VIHINLLAGQRKGLKKRAPLQVGQKLIVGCSLIMVTAVGFIGWRFWALGQESARLDSEIASAQAETARLHSIIEQVQQFEQRRAQLQQRVTLIEQLRKDQTGPVHMLDQISRALPSMLWLTELKQSPSSSEVLIAGRCTTMTGLSDFVANLEASGYFQRSIEIVSSTTEIATTPPGEMIRFEIKAVFQTPTDAKASTGTGMTPEAVELKPRS